MTLGTIDWERSNWHPNMIPYPFGYNAFRCEDCASLSDLGNYGSNVNGESSSKGRGQPRPLSKIQSYYCHRFGHTMKFCKKKQQDEREDAKFKNESKEEDTMFMTFEIDEIVMNDDWNNMTAKYCMRVAVDNVLHGKFWNVDDLEASNLDDVETS